MIANQSRKKRMPWEKPPTPWKKVTPPWELSSTASISGGAAECWNGALRKKYHVVRKKTHVVRKLFYVASIFGGANRNKDLLLSAKHTFTSIFTDLAVWQAPLLGSYIGCPLKMVAVFDEEAMNFAV